MQMQMPMPMPMPMNYPRQGVTAYSPAMSSGKNVGIGSIVGGATAGFMELLVFHPVDTTAKRLMTYKGTIIQPGNLSGTWKTLNEVVFRDKATAGMFTKWKSMFPGLGYAAWYKIMQRTYKFGGQPFVYKFVDNLIGPKTTEIMGAKKGKIFNSALAGSLLGIGEVVLLPFDVLKIKAQTNPETLKGRGIVDLFRNEGRNLYKGAGWTMFRNAPGSFSLFGGSAMVYYGFFKLEDQKKATFAQHTAASIIGATLSITVASPTDVIKTRIQNQPFDQKVSGFKIVGDLMKNEGPGAFFKGLTPKIIVVGPKLVFAMTISQTIMAWFAA